MKTYINFFWNRNKHFPHNVIDIDLDKLGIALCKRIEEVCGEQEIQCTFLVWREMSANNCYIGIEADIIKADTIEKLRTAELKLYWILKQIVGENVAMDFPKQWNEEA